MPIQYMYPEGWLIDPLGKSLLFFEKDPMNPMYEGYIGFWMREADCSKRFRYRKRSSKTKALAQWMRMLNEGWKIIEDREYVA